MSYFEPDADLLAASDKALKSINVGRLQPAANTFDVHDPATEEVIASLPDHTPEDALAALAKADAAGKEWAKTSPRKRSDVLHAVYAKLIENKDTLAYVISREMGKPLAEGYAEVQYSADYVRWFAEEALRAQGLYRDSPAGDATILVRRSPVGNAVLIAPWNFPMAMATRKIAPALAAGCACVVKPANLTPLTTVIVLDLMIQAGVPEDLVQVITTTNASGFSSTLLADQRVRKISFTGSTPVGSTLMGLAAKNIVKSSMELGGNAPLLVFDDADLDRAVEGAILAKMRNGGQTCVAANRMFIQEGIADAFVEKFTAAMAAHKLGNAMNKETTLGPVIDDRAVQRLQHLVDDAVAKGATLKTGGKSPDRPGHYFEPTVLDNVPAIADIATTEIFGPVAAITRFKTQAEAIEKANDTEFGLAAFVFTQDLDRAINVAEALETGMVGINNGLLSNIAAPFGGVKASGTGREGGAEGLDEYQEIRYFTMKRRETN
ncbi:MAG: NAD-dependent succinate-semialdehyde dehydrogenase [Microbacteriaceae bacterium]